jgi:4-hydroxy-tetrahydrodipicolinate synthase
VAFDRALARGDLAAGRALWRRLKPLTEGLFEEPSPGPVKAVLAAQGECANELRAPMTTASEALTDRLLALIADLPERS